MSNFKVGDVITPMREVNPAWKNMTILEWNQSTQDATVQTEGGTVIHGFNLNPNYGVPFKCVNQS